MAVELFNMDCMEYMEGYEDNAFDLAIVDPPYGIGDFSMQTSGAMKGRQTKVWDYKWNDQIPSEKYFSELKRISKTQIIWGANYYNRFENGGAIVWDKKNEHPDMSRCELASVSSSRLVKYFYLPWLGFMKGPTIHPCQKPVKLYQWILENYAKPGQRILDTHLGSGSSAIAAHYFRCDFVGCEIDKDYYGAAVKRFDQETRQMALI